MLRTGAISVDRLRAVSSVLAENELYAEDAEQDAGVKPAAPHPLEAEGFLSVGCMPCSGRVEPGEERRAGRWRNSNKTECGIHWPRASLGDGVG